jgi:hypothetical protein
MKGVLKYASDEAKHVQPLRSAGPPSLNRLNKPTGGHE